MHWPADHPACLDAGLAPWLGGADDLCPGGRLGPILRHLPGRRLTIGVEMPGSMAVLKVFARPRARGNHRRLAALGETAAAHVVPRTGGVDPSGHVGLVSWRPGTPLHLVADDLFVEGCRRAGAALAAVHTSGAMLDRTWTVDDEVTQLRRRALPDAGHLVDRAAAIAEALGGLPLVSAHRDFHPRQIILEGECVGLIDLDDAAMAPAALDVGNFIAHLRRDCVVGARDPAQAEAAIAAFRQGYGPVDPTEVWEWLSLLRLMSLASTRHARPDWSAALRRVVTATAPVLA